VLRRRVLVQSFFNLTEADLAVAATNRVIFFNNQQ
jgi:hypothetical protein